MFRENFFIPCIPWLTSQSSYSLTLSTSIFVGLEFIYFWGKLFHHLDSLANFAEFILYGCKRYDERKTSSYPYSNLDERRGGGGT